MIYLSLNAVPSILLTRGYKHVTVAQQHLAYNGWEVRMKKIPVDDFDTYYRPKQYDLVEAVKKFLAECINQDSITAKQLKELAK